MDDIGLCMQIKSEYIYKISEDIRLFKGTILMYQTNPQSWTLEWLDNFDEFLDLNEIYAELGWLNEN